MALNLASEQRSPSVSPGHRSATISIGRRDRASAPPAIEVRGIRKRYGDRDVLADVSLLVRPGCLHGLLGPNGAGKTTLMRVMLGLIQPDAGSVHLLGAPVGPRPIRSPTVSPATSRLPLLSVSVRTPEPVAPRPSRRWPFVGPSGTRRTRARAGGSEHACRHRRLGILGGHAPAAWPGGGAAAIAESAAARRADQLSRSRRRARRAHARQGSGRAGSGRGAEQPRHGRGRGALRRADGDQSGPGRVFRQRRGAAAARAGGASRSAHQRRPRGPQVGLGSARPQGAALGCRRGRSRGSRRHRRAGRIHDCARAGRDRAPLARAPHSIAGIAVPRAHG